MNMKYKKPNNYEEALKIIEQLQAELDEARATIEMYKNRKIGGRPKHDAKWQASYDYFVELYEAGNPMSHIVEVSDFSRRTAYRYKEYYDKLNNVNKNTPEE